MTNAKFEVYRSCSQNRRGHNPYTAGWKIAEKRMRTGRANRQYHAIVPVHGYNEVGKVPDSEMRIFGSAQGRTRVCGEAYAGTPQPETRGERRAGPKRPFLG
jgi:hypothetical protein